ncbi:FMR1-interacting protein NUFIP1-like [Phymastichus coffea]|uniref:FMR1-interacting protein NUFIP1-like n=1 Tax=Phymastichus coffea TaxID=108790 RepID=UPI00273C6ABB|nr:FMR1-interacting protein NUFIP1-like [Phymastichus coffea]XP_058791801.1 FMR1-interacting protein NUFIP1-like [Phymastichus coffea]
MSPLNKGPMMAPGNPAALRGPPMPRYGRVPPPLPPPPRMGRPMPPPPIFGHPRGRPLPTGLPRPGPMMGRPNGPPGLPPMFGPRGRPMPPMPPMPPMGPMRGPMGPRVLPMMRPGPRGILPPHVLPHTRPRFPPNHTNGKKMNNNKNNKLKELELKKPWMTEEIRTEIQKKNKLYAKAKKNKDTNEWKEFKHFRNKVIRMIRNAENEYYAKNPDQAHLYQDDEVVESDNSNESCFVDSEDDEEVSLYCEICDREFCTVEQLQQHVNEHQTCKIDGCTFTAHPKIVEKHISMQHCTGLYQRMKSVMSDGDIEKWKAERKRRYPTAANTKLQEAEQLEKKQRGEVVESQANKLTRPQAKKERRKNRKRPKQFKIIVPDDEPVRELYRGLIPFAGTQTLDVENGNRNNFVDQETFEKHEVEEAIENFVVSDEDEKIDELPATSEPLNNLSTIDVAVVPAVSRLMSLVADYGSDSNNDEPPEEVPIKRMKVEEEDLQTKSNEVINNIQSKVPTKENASTIKSADVRLTSSEESTKQRDKRFQKSKDFERKSNSFNRKRNDSQYSNGRLRLLNKLLSRSIQHERNAIFQCITFIEKNSFFD